MKRLLIVPVLLCALFAGGAVRIVQDQCGPFTDVTPAFCPYVLELYYLGITVGTSATTFAPDDPLTRGQGAVFVAKELDQALARSSRRAALGQWWTTTPHYDLGLGVIALGGVPSSIASDGVDIWVSSFGGTVSRVRASDGKLLETWTGGMLPRQVLVAMGRVLVLGTSFEEAPLYAIDPTQPAGVMTAVAIPGHGPQSMAFDGARVFVSNNGGIAHIPSIAIIAPTAAPPWSVTTVTNPIHSLLGTLIFDGTNILLLNGTELLRLASDGSVLQATSVLSSLGFGSAFDGENLWTLNSTDDEITIVRASTGIIVATLTGNGLNHPEVAAFDGQRILITNTFGDSVSLWKAADLTPLGSVSTGAGSQPSAACSDGITFWIGLSPNLLGRF
jgi:hypothetical protein